MAVPTVQYRSCIRRAVMPSFDHLLADFCFERRPTAAAADCTSPGESGCSGNGAGRRDGTSTTAVLRQVLLPGQELCQRFASGEPQLCIQAVAQLLMRLWMFALPCGEQCRAECATCLRDIADGLVFGHKLREAAVGWVLGLY